MVVYSKNMTYKSIENKPAVDKNADTPELKREVINRILDIWLQHPDAWLVDIFNSAGAFGGLPHKLSDRDLLHRVETYFTGKAQDGI